MKFSSSLALLIASFTLSNALLEDQVKGLDLSIPNKPHNVHISKSAIVSTKRDSPAEIEVADSDTIPIEDSASGLSVSSSSKSNKVVSYSTGTSLSSAAPKLTSTTNQLSQVNVDKTGKSGVVIDDEEATNEEKTSTNSPFLMAISMIIVSEIGDKTFLISALMAMRHSRVLVFSASFASLALMTVLSGIVGHTLPTLISQRVTQFLAAGLFLIFGFKLTKEGLAMSKDLGVDEELAEVEEELTVQDINYDLNDVEAGSRNHGRVPVHRGSQWKQTLNSIVAQVKALASQVFSPLWVQVFVMIFLGEWGDRSQIATIAMAAGSNYWLVIFGAVIGHGLCTLASVIGGKLLASRISMRTVTLGGAFAFLVFSVLYFIEAFNGESA